jgi:uncharacterized membrane-anchored protein YitT (DUF2179 family)
MTKPSSRTSTAGEVAINLLYLVVGSLLGALGVNGILVPHHFVSGGVSGLALEVVELFPAFSLSAVYLVLNIPLFAAGWLVVGRRFFIYSLIGTLLLTAGLAFVKVPVPVHDPLLAALLAGILIGAGAGLALRSQGSPGGVGILSIVIFKRFGIPLGTTFLFWDALVLSGAVLIFSLEAALYAAVTIFVASRMIDMVVTGISRRKTVTIVSAQAREVARAVIEEIDRGATILKGEGAFSGRPVEVVYTVVLFRELVRLKRLVRAIDPEAFLVVGDTREVIGWRIGNEPDW